MGGEGTSWRDYEDYGRKVEIEAMQEWKWGSE